MLNLQVQWLLKDRCQAMKPNSKESDRIHLTKNKYKRKDESVKPCLVGYWLIAATEEIS